MLKSYGLLRVKQNMKGEKGQIMRMHSAGCCQERLAATEASLKEAEVGFRIRQRLR